MGNIRFAGEPTVNLTGGNFAFSATTSTRCR
jgi:hypothetical protein